MYMAHLQPIQALHTYIWVPYICFAAFIPLLLCILLFAYMCLGILQAVVLYYLLWENLGALWI